MTSLLLFLVACCVAIISNKRKLSSSMYNINDIHWHIFIYSLSQVHTQYPFSIILSLIIIQKRVNGLVKGHVHVL